MAIFNYEYLEEYAEIFSNKKLYRVSKYDYDGKIIKPSIPDNYFTKNGFEENKTPIVCFSTSIGKCLMALSENIKNTKFYVYTPDPENEYNIYKPTIEEVPDSKITGELWILKPVKMKCIGKIICIKDSGKDGHKFRYGDNIAELYDWNWKWLEKYKN